MDSVLIYQLEDANLLAQIVAENASDLDLGFNATSWLADPLNVALTDGRNLGLFECKGAAWEGHVIFTDRGAVALSVGRQMLKIMFDDYLVKVIKGLTPAHKRAARYFNRKLGFLSFGLIETIHGPMELFILERPQ